MQVPQLGLMLVALFAIAHAKRLDFENNLSYTIWVGSLGNDGQPPIENGGWEMAAGSRRSFDVADNYAGRVWARTGCNFDANGNGPCETGDCGNKLLCEGAGGKPPATLAEFTFQGAGGQDFYDISLVDGYNVPSAIIPIDNVGGGDMYRCTEAACPSTTINDECPQELQVQGESGPVGCQSACGAFNTDEYCCRGAYGTPETCVANNWSYNYPRFFKDRCPLAYSYAYDDNKSTFTCENTNYRITFG